MIDCPPNVGVFAINALMAADGVIIPVDMSYLGLVGQSQKTAHSPQFYSRQAPSPPKKPQVSPALIPTLLPALQPSSDSSESGEVEETPDVPAEETPAVHTPAKPPTVTQGEPLEEPTSESDDPGSGSSKLPASDPNPLNAAGDSMDALIQKGINADLWQHMLGDLPCVDATNECIAQLQATAVQQNPLLNEVDSRIEEINSKIEEAKAANKKSVDLSVLRPAARVFLEPTFNSQAPNGQRQRGPVEKVFSVFTSPVGVVNEVLRAVGIPLFDKLFGGGNEQAQGRSIASADLQVKLAESSGVEQSWQIR